MANQDRPTPIYDLLLEMAQLLDSFRAKSSGWHGSGRHIGQDFEFCSGYDGSDGTEARPCSPRCASTKRVIEQAAERLGIPVEQLGKWKEPRKARTRRSPDD